MNAREYLLAALAIACGGCSYEGRDCRNLAARYVADRGTADRADDVQYRCTFEPTGATEVCSADDGLLTLARYPSTAAFIAAQDFERRFAVTAVTRVRPDGSRERTVLTYDGAGRLLDRRGPVAAETYRDWDPRGRPMAGDADTLDCGGAAVSVTYSDDALTERWTYAGGAPATPRGCDDRVVLQRFDLDGNLVERTVAGGGMQRTERFTILETHEICDD